MVSFKTTLLAMLTSVATIDARRPNLHPNKGCIIVDNGACCAGSWVKIGPVAEIKGVAYASCYLNAEVPQNYGDVYWGADDCLHDSEGNNMGCARYGQDTQVDNPYH